MPERRPAIPYRRPEKRYPRTWPKRALVVLGVLLAGALGLVLSGRWLADKFLFSGYTESLTRQQIDRIGAMGIPANAMDVRARVRSWQDTLLVVRFSISPGDLAAFLDSTGIERPLSTTEIPGAFATHTDWYAPWWRPGTPTAFEAGEGQVVRTRTDPEDGSQWEETVLQEVMIDKSNPLKYIVWVRASGD